MEIALKNDIGMGTVVRLLPTETSDLDDFKLALQASFRVAVTCPPEIGPQVCYA